MQLAKLWQLLVHDERDCEMQLSCIQKTDRATLSAPNATWLRQREGELMNELNKLRRLRMATPTGRIVAITLGGRA